MAPVRDLTARRSGGTKGHLPPLILLGSNDPTSRNILCPRAGPLHPVGHTGDPLRRRLVASGTGRQSGGRQLGWPFPRRSEPHARVQSLIGQSGLGVSPPLGPQTPAAHFWSGFFLPVILVSTSLGSGALKEEAKAPGWRQGPFPGARNYQGMGLIGSGPRPSPLKQRKGRDKPGLLRTFVLRGKAYFSSQRLAR